ncbi:MAG: preprotein translocase subunit YajC [Terrimesophilobacter sp.]
MDYTLILIAVVLAVFVFFQFRSSRKRQKDAAERQATLLPGAEVMTNFGMYGTLVSIDEEENLAFLEIAPKTIIKLHRQVILKAVEPVVAEETSSEATGSETGGPELNTSNAIPMAEPEYGERTKKPTRKKPASDSE